MEIKFKISIIFTLIVYLSATLGPSKKNKGKQKAVVEIKMNKGPVNEDVFGRTLVELDPLASSIIAEANTYYKDTSIRNFNGSVLGYVTPVKLKFSIAY